MSSSKDLSLSEREHQHRKDQVWKALLVVLALFRLGDVVTIQRELPRVLVDVAPTVGSCSRREISTAPSSR